MAHNKKAYDRAYRARNKGKIRAYRAAYYTKNKAHLDKLSRKSELKLKYGISPKERSDLLAKQNGHCWFCERTEMLSVDHDHETGKVRGLLCRYHNTALGAFGDNESGLNNALAYLRKK